MANTKPQVLDKTFCISCNRLIPSNEFLPNYNRIHKKYNNSKMCYCKSCCKDISNEILSEYWSLGKNPDDIFAYKLAIRAICVLFDLPYLDDAAEQLYNNQTNTTKTRDINLVYNYQQIMKELSYSDELYDNLTGNSLLVYNLMPRTKDNNNVSLTQSGDMELMNYLSLTWGEFNSIDDYLFLEERFHTYTDGEDLTPAIQNLIRYCCVAELDVKQLRKAKADQKEITQAEKRVNDYYKQLGFDKIKLKANQSAAEKLIETWAYNMENIEPLDWVDENLEDICKFREDNDEIMRAIGNKILGTQDYPTLTYEDVNNEPQKKKVKKYDSKAKTGKT